MKMRNFWKPKPGEPYRPLILIPPHVNDMGPWLKGCAFRAFDPPRSLNPASLLAPDSVPVSNADAQATPDSNGQTLAPLNIPAPKLPEQTPSAKQQASSLAPKSGDPEKPADSPRPSKDPQIAANPNQQEDQHPSDPTAQGKQVDLGTSHSGSDHGGDEAEANLRNDQNQKGPTSSPDAVIAVQSTTPNSTEDKTKPNSLGDSQQNETPGNAIGDSQKGYNLDKPQDSAQGNQGSNTLNHSNISPDQISQLEDALALSHPNPAAGQQNNADKQKSPLRDGQSSGKTQNPEDHPAGAPGQQAGNEQQSLQGNGQAPKSSPQLGNNPTGVPLQEAGQSQESSQGNDKSPGSSEKPKNDPAEAATQNAGNEQQKSQGNAQSGGKSENSGGEHAQDSVQNPPTQPKSPQKDSQSSENPIHQNNQQGNSSPPGIEKSPNAPDVPNDSLAHDSVPIFPTQPPIASPLVTTIAGQPVTAHVSEVALPSTDLTPGAPGATVSGMSVSLNTAGGLVVGGSTVTLASAGATSVANAGSGSSVKGDSRPATELPNSSGTKGNQSISMSGQGAPGGEGGEPFMGEARRLRRGVGLLVGMTVGLGLIL